MEHALHERPRAVWETVLECWGKHSAENLDHNDKRHTLLRDRHAAADAFRTPTHEEVFRAIHACSLQTLQENWQSQQNSKTVKRRDYPATMQRIHIILRQRTNNHTPVEGAATPRAHSPN